MLTQNKLSLVTFFVFQNSFLALTPTILDLRVETKICLEEIVLKILMKLNLDTYLRGYARRFYFHFEILWYVNF